ncbi:ABC transporter ATP-binding protein [Streptomyces sp. NPDC002078]
MSPATSRLGGPAPDTSVLTADELMDDNGRRESAEGSRANTSRTFRTYWQVLTGHRVAAGIVVAVSVTAGTAEALGLASLLPLLRRDGDPHDGSSGAGYVLLFALCAVFAVALRVCADVLIARLSGRIERRLRFELLDGLFELDWRRFASLRRGDLVSAVMSEATQVANGATACLTGGSTAAVAAVLAVTAGVVGGVLALSTALFVIVLVWLHRRMTRVASRCQQAFGRENADLVEDTGTLLQGLKYFRSSGSTDWWRKRLSEATDRVRRIQLRSTAASVVAKGAVASLGALFLAAILLLAIFHDYDFATALMFVAIFYRTLPQLQSAQGQLLTARAQTVWWHRWTQRRAWIAEEADRRHGGLPVPREIRSIELRNVAVAYPGREGWALRDVSLKLQRGRTYVVIGETGGGKTTLLDLVTGLILPDQGRVLVNDVPMDGCDLSHWQRRIAFVPQEPVIFHGTIRHNVGWPGADADDGMLKAALDAAQMSAFVTALREGLDTTVGQQGSALSGGQRQRIGVARALFANRPVLVLDEATGALDPDTEARLLDEVFRASADRITLFVTHRHEAAQRADEVIVIRDGRVAMIGSPQEILGGRHAAV